MLERILPAPVLEKLLTGHSLVADSYKSCTVIFTDLVGFTKMSAGQKPEALVSLMNAMYSVFDTVITINRCFKVETIGDAYLIASDVGAACLRHVVAIGTLISRELTTLPTFAR